MSHLKSIAMLAALLSCMSCTCFAQDEPQKADENAEVTQEAEVKNSDTTEQESPGSAEEASDDSVPGASADDSSDAGEKHDGEAHDKDATDHGGESHAEGEHGHVDLDPTHANVSDATWEVVDFRTDMALFSGVVFLLLLAGLYGSAWKPIMDGLEKREESIAANIAKAEEAAEDAQAKLADYESKLEAANEEAATIVAEARKDAEAAGQKLIAAAQEEAARLKERATDDVETAKRVALGELADQSTEVAMAVAQRVVGREVKADDHQALIQEMLAKLPSKN